MHTNKDIVKLESPKSSSSHQKIKLIAAKNILIHSFRNMYVKIETVLVHSIKLFILNKDAKKI